MKISHLMKKVYAYTIKESNMCFVYRTKQSYGSCNFIHLIELLGMKFEQFTASPLPQNRSFTCLFSV